MLTIFLVLLHVSHFHEHCHPPFSFSGLAESAKNSHLKSKLNRKKKEDTLFDAAAEGPSAERAERDAKYQNLKEQHLNKWEQIAHQHERKPQVVFPLNGYDSKVAKKDLDDTAVKSFHFTPRNALELEMAKLFNPDSKVSAPADGGLSEFEKKLMEKLSVKEMRARVADLRKERFLISSIEAKNKRQKKIKSKSFRRMQRKIVEKQEEKATNLAVTQAKAGQHEALQILEDDKEFKRLDERAGLRHKHTSTAVRDKKRYEKFNDSEKEAQTERERLHRELVQKGRRVEEDDVEDEEIIPGEEKAVLAEIEGNKKNKDVQSLDTVRKLFKGDDWVGPATDVKKLI